MNTEKTAAGQRRDVPLDRLCFDPDMPRLPAGKRTGDEQRILQWMLINGDLPQLMLSIASSGYDEAEPLLVTPGPNGFIVVDGNRRLAALKLLHAPKLAPLRQKTVAGIAASARHQNITQVPVILYEQRQDIVSSLGFRHITGIRPWGPREKADYLGTLRERHGTENESDEKTFALISERVGTRPQYARRLLQTLAVVKWAEDHAFWGNEAVARSIDTNFVLIHTALAHGGIRAYIGLGDGADEQPDELDARAAAHLFDWLCGNRKISDSRDLPRLDSVLSSPAALAMLERGVSLEEASKYSREALNDFRSFMQRAGAMLEEADRLLTRAENFDESDCACARDLARLAKKIAVLIKDMVDRDRSESGTTDRHGPLA